MAQGNPQEVVDFFYIDRETGYVQIQNGLQFQEFDFDNLDYKVEIRVNAMDNPNTLINGQPSNLVETKTLLLQMNVNFDPQFPIPDYPVEFVENAIFGANDPKAEDLPLAIDPNNEEEYIDEICYFVYGKCGHLTLLSFKRY